MSTTYAERKTQALSIQELIQAIAGVQALIRASVESPWCPNSVKMNLGRAYHNLAFSLSERVV